MRLTLIPAAALALALSGGVAAQPGMAGDEMPRHMDRMAEKLELTDTQRTQVAELMKAHHERMQAAREQLHEDLKKLLTPEQAAKLDAMHERMGEHRGEHKRGERKRGEHRH